MQIWKINAENHEIPKGSGIVSHHSLAYIALYILEFGQNVEAETISLTSGSVSTIHKVSKSQNQTKNHLHCLIGLQHLQRRTSSRSLLYLAQLRGGGGVIGCDLKRNGAERIKQNNEKNHWLKPWESKYNLSIVIFSTEALNSYFPSQFTATSSVVPGL